MAPYLQRATNRADLARVDLVMVLGAMLSWDQQSQLAEQVPATLTTACRSNGDDRLRARPPDGFGASSRHVRHTFTPDDRQWSPVDDRTALAGEPPDPDHQRSPRVLGRIVGHGPQGARWAVPKHLWPADPSTAPAQRLKDRPAD